MLAASQTAEMASQRFDPTFLPRFTWSSTLRDFGQTPDFRDAVDAFLIRAQELQAAFFQQQASSGRPRGLIWTTCDFSGDPKFAAEAGSDLTAWWGVTISFTAVPGGPMEGVEAVGNLRAASAEFARKEGVWQPVRVHFNLEPEEAITFARDNAGRQLSMIET